MAGRNNKGAVWSGVDLNQHIIEAIINIESNAGAGECAGMLEMLVFPKSFLNAYTREIIIV